MRFLLSALVALLATGTSVDAHSYLTEPTPRNVGGVCRWSAPSDQFGNLNCRGPCERDTPGGALHRANRGDRINVAWSRNNHGGGFIRLAWAPTSQSTNANVFNDNVQKFSCYEVGAGCRASNGQPSGGSDTLGTQTKNCNTAIEIPNWLPNGRYTLQWSWFGGIFDFGDYYSCADFDIIGGPNPPAQFGRAAAKANPVFEGGDMKYSGQQQCEFVNADRINVCDREPCRDPVNAQTRAPFAQQFPYNQRRGGRPFSAQPLVIMPGRDTNGASRGSSGSNGEVVPGGTPQAPVPPNETPNPSPPGTTDISAYANGMPRSIGTSGAFTVGVTYAAAQASVIFADLLQTGTWTKFGFATARVGAGRGQLNLRINPTSNPPVGTNYIINAWIVSTDSYNQNPATAWQRAVLKGFPVEVKAGNAAFYNLPNTIDGIPGSVPRAIPRLAVGAEFQVSFSYEASTTRELQVDLLTANYQGWFASGKVTVPGGRGRATISVPITNGYAAQTDLIINLLSMAPGAKWDTPGTVIKPFPVKVESALRLSSAEGDSAAFNATGPGYADLPADAFDNDVDVAKQTCTPVNATYCAPLNGAATSQIGAAVTLLMAAITAALAL